MSDNYLWDDVPPGFGDAYGDPGPQAKWSPAILAHMAEAGIDPQAADARARLEAHFAQQNREISPVVGIAKVRAAAALRHTEGLLDAIQSWGEQTAEQRLAVLERFSAAICHEWGFSGVPVDDVALGYGEPTQGLVYTADEAEGSIDVAINPLHTRTTDEIVVREVDEEQQQLAAEDGREGIQLGPGMLPFEMIAPERRAQEMRPGVEAYTGVVREGLATRFWNEQFADGKAALWIIGHEVAGHVAQAIMPLVAEYVPANVRPRYDNAARILDWNNYITPSEDQALYKAQPVEAMANEVGDFVVAQAQRLIDQQRDGTAGHDDVPPGDNSEAGS